MSTPESKVKKEVRTLLDSYQLFYNMPVPTGYGSSMLDFVCCFRGKFFMIETKAAGKKLTPRQEFTKLNVEAAGGKVFVVTGSEETHPETWIGWLELELWLDAVEADNP